MSEVDPVIFEFRARVNGYLADVKRTTQTVDQQLGTQEKRIKRLEGEMRRSSGAIGNSLRGLAATLATAFTGRELVGLIDSFTRLQNNLRVAGLEGEKLALVQERLRDIGARYGVQLETLSAVFLKASLAQKELGASTDQIIQLNEIVAASLKITGTSAEQARGALLQLGQALGSDIVRGEEFNSLLENALPLVQAAARGIDRFGGSVARLRKEVVDGKVTSREFFEGILKGGVQTLNDAEKATLTLSGAFTSLRNELTLYFGEAAKSNGATEALAAAIQALASNLDRIIPALAVIATVLSGRFLAGALAGGKALQVLSAHASIATTSMAGLGLAATSAGSAMLKALGGLPGILISLALALGYVIANAESAAEKTERFADAASKAESEADALEQRLRDAGLASDSMKAAMEQAAGKVDGLTSSMGRAISEAIRLAQALNALELMKIGADNLEIQRERAIIEQGKKTNRLKRGRAGMVLEGNASNREADAQLAELAQREAANTRSADAIITAMKNGLDITSPKASPAPAAVTKAGKPKKEPKGASGPSAADIAERAAQFAARIENEIAALNVDRLRIIADLTGSAEDRATAEHAALKADRDAFNRQLVLDKELDAAQRRDLTAARDAADAQRRRAIEVDRSANLAREKFALESAANRLEQEVVAARGSVNDRTAAERRMTDLRLIDLQFSERQAEAERAYSDAVEAGNTVAADIARSELARLEDLRALAAEAARLRNLSPIEKLREDLNRTRGQIAEDVEQVEVRALQNLEDGIVDAIRGAENLGDVFSAVADQIIADLIRIAVQQAIIRPIAELLGGGGGFGGVFGAIVGAFGAIGGGGSTNGGLSGTILPSTFRGRASGGHVNAGTMYRVNEGGSPGRVEAFVPQGAGDIIPLGRMNAMRGGGAPQGTVRIIIEEAEGFASRVRTEAAGVAIEVQRAAAPGVVRAAVSETFRQAGRPKI